VQLCVNAEDAGHCGVNIPAMDIPGSPSASASINTAVAALAEWLGKFRGELMAGDDFDVLAGERPGKQAAGVPAKRVITSQGIAVADDQRSEVRSPKSGGRNSEPEIARAPAIFDFRFSIFGSWTSDFGPRTSDLFIDFSVHPTKNPPVPSN